jgi:Chaperone of endosialidase
MKTIITSSVVLISVLVSTTGPAYGSQPPDVVQSDTAGNTAMGGNALLGLTSGNDNTAAGFDALEATTSGYKNSAFGWFALGSNTSGYNNAAFGQQTLQFNTTGYDNTALGTYALAANTTGTDNTASGFLALYSNTTGIQNTAYGASVLEFNTTGNYNTASGNFALQANTTGNSNSASGTYALFSNTTGYQNTSSGFQALEFSTTGFNNTAYGTYALQNNTTGNSNIAEGFQAGSNLTTGSNNIDVGNVGVAGESNTIRIGTHGTQRATFIAGIYGASVTGSTVMVTPAGKLGVATSSERFKTAIAPMGANTAKLGQLRPVTFHLKTDPHGALQYGLIAEEVAKVYPELVIRGEKGRIDGVRYDELAPMLLNEVQQQQNKIAALEQQLAQMQVALLNLQTKDELVARR